MAIRLSERYPSDPEREEILRLSEDEKLAWYDEKVRSAHPNLVRARGAVELMCGKHTGRDIILLIGPCGVGKKVLIDSFKARMWESSHARLQSDRGHIPVVSYTVPSSGDSAFSWGGFYRSLGKEVGVQSGRNLLERRTAVEDGLQRRGTGVVVIDEAVNMVQDLAIGKAKGKVRVLTSFGAIPGVKFLLVGSYDLHRIAGLSGQLARRIEVVHFQRYHRSIAEEQRVFYTVFHQLVESLPLERVPDLDEAADIIHLATAGCIGILKQTLMVALTRTLADGGEWKMEHLRDSILKPKQLGAVLEEIERGEDEIAGKRLDSSVNDIYERASKTLSKMARRPQ